MSSNRQVRRRSRGPGAYARDFTATGRMIRRIMQAEALAQRMAVNLDYRPIPQETSAERERMEDALLAMVELEEIERQLSTQRRTRYNDAFPPGNASAEYRD